MIEHGIILTLFAVIIFALFTALMYATSHRNYEIEERERWQRLYLELSGEFRRFLMERDRNDDDIDEEDEETP